MSFVKTFLNFFKFGVNQKDITSKNDKIICVICGIEAIFAPCEASLVLE